MADFVEHLSAALKGSYRIERELAQGGMGLVFLAHDLKHDRKVALKVLRPELAQSLGTNRFLREIRISAQLNHPNILTLIDSGTADGFMYYVMPYVEGETLRDRLRREQQLPLEEALRIIREAADALAHAHGLGIVHRDIKPENVLLSQGHALLADFGIAHAVSEAGGERITESGMAVGTPVYMSPEQATASGPTDARSDIYSLACVLYEMLAGSPPYTGPTPQAVLARKVVEPIPSLRVVRETVPAWLEAAIMRALAKVPADRFATAREFATALSGAGEPVAPRVPGDGWPRGRLFTLASAVVVVAAAGYIALALTGPHEAGPSIAGATFNRVTVDPGVERFPSLSPDGQWVVYSGEASGNRDIYLMSVGGGNPIDLTADSPDDDDQPAFSPDGEHIAFRSERDGGGIFVMGRTGEAVRRVTQGGYRPSWNPDGTRIAFSTENVGLYPQNSESRGELWVVDVRTGETRRVTGVDAALPSWSPHDIRIAFLHRLGDTSGGHIWTVPVTGGEPTPATQGTSRDWSPAWSPDGRYLYYVSDRAGSMNLWRVEIDEESGRPKADPEPLRAPGTSLAHVALSGDGTRIAYSSTLVTANVQRSPFDPERGIVKGEPEWVTRGSRHWADPDPSPDGRQVAFYSLMDPEGDLYVARSDGVGAPRQVTGDEASDRLPRWSPDGDWISVFSDRSGPLQIWKIHPDGSGLTELTRTLTPAAFSVWSPDGSLMAAATLPSPEDGHTIVFDPDRPWKDQKPDTLPPAPDSLEPFSPHSWSPDGAMLAGMIASVDRGIVTYSFDRRTYEHVTDFGQWPVWLPDARRILFVSGGSAFYVVDRVTKRVDQVFSSGRDVIGPPQLTRDGTMVYYTRSVREADIWIMTLH